jgi:glycosyltransferase involved in cell wall biosynthesis
MISLCIDARMINSSGIGTCIQNLIPHLSKKPFHLSLLVRNKNQSLEGTEILFDVPIYSLSEQIRFSASIPPCDLFWSPHYNSPLLPIRAKKRIITLHDVCHLALPSFLSIPKRFIAKMLMKGSCALSDRIITDSQFSKGEILNYLSPDPGKIEVIHPGVDRNRFKKVENQAQKKPYFLFVGNLKPHKNIAGLIRAFDLFSHESLQPYDLILVGKYEGLRSVDPILDEAIRRRKNIQVLGEVPASDLPGLYSGAAALVFPSFYEGFGLPPLEAMACGTPVIASSVASLPEICKEAAHYVSPYDYRDIARGMDRIATDLPLRTELISQGIRQAAKFEWEKTGAEYRALFEEVHFEKRSRS